MTVLIAKHRVADFDRPVSNHEVGRLGTKLVVETLHIEFPLSCGDSRPLKLSRLHLLQENLPNLRTISTRFNWHSKQKVFMLRARDWRRVAIGKTCLMNIETCICT